MPDGTTAHKLSGIGEDLRTYRYSPAKRVDVLCDGQPRLSVGLTGDNPRVLLVHGATCTAASWASTLVALAELGNQAAALDLRGHGFSDGREDLQRWRIEDYVSDVIAVLRRWETLRIVVGHSMGGLVAQLVAATMPLDRLVLVASSPTEGMRRNGFRMARAHGWTFAVAALLRSFRRLYKSPEVARSLLFHQNTRLEVVERFVAIAQEESWIAGNQMNTLLPEPRSIACPVAVIAGESDFMVDRRASERTARDYSTSLRILADCGHMVPWEADPAELARAIVGVSSRGNR